MKTLGGRTALAIALLASVWFAYKFLHQKEPVATNGLRYESLPLSSEQANALLSKGPVVAPKGFTTRAVDMSDLEKALFIKSFNEKLKPAIERWARVYAGRIPFQVEDVRIENFHSRLVGNFYTFMIGDTTLTVADSNEGARVFYMMTRAGVKSLNSVPSSGAAPNLSMPVNRVEITSLLKADSGIDYPPGQIQIHPTGAATFLAGGVMVEAGGITGDGEFRAMTKSNLNFVLGPDGNLVSYQH